MQDEPDMNALRGRFAGSVKRAVGQQSSKDAFKQMFEAVGRERQRVVLSANLRLGEDDEHTIELLQDQLRQKQGELEQAGRLGLALHDELTQLEAEHTQVQEQLERAKEENAALQHAVVELKLDLAANVEAHNAKEEDEGTPSPHDKGFLSALASQQSMRDASFHALKDEADTLQDQVEALKDLVAQKDEAINLTRSHLHTMSAKEQSMRDRAEQAQSELRELQDQVAALNDQLRAAQMQAHSAQSKQRASEQGNGRELQLEQEKEQLLRELRAERARVVELEGEVKELVEAGKDDALQSRSFSESLVGLEALMEEPEEEEEENERPEAPPPPRPIPFFAKRVSDPMRLRQRVALQQDRNRSQSNWLLSTIKKPDKPNPKTEFKKESEKIMRLVRSNRRLATQRAICTQLVMLQAMTSTQKPMAPLVESHAPSWTWSPKPEVSALTLSEDKLTLVHKCGAHGSDQRPVVVQGSKAFSEGEIAYFEVEVDAVDSGGAVVIGVARDSGDGDEQMVWGLRINDSVMVEGEPEDVVEIQPSRGLARASVRRGEEELVVSVCEGDRIGVLVDGQQRQLMFFHNATRLVTEPCVLSELRGLRSVVVLSAATSVSLTLVPSDLSLGAPTRKRRGTLHTPTLAEGVLAKRVFGLGRLRHLRRIFKLIRTENGAVLVYANSEAKFGGKVHGFLLEPGTRVVEELDADFQIEVSPGIGIKLQAPSVEDRERWVRALHRAVGIGI